MDQVSLSNPLSRRGIAPKKLKREQVRLRLLREITGGNLRPGDVLPAEHDLAELMGVSRSTIRQTLGDMEREGEVRRVRGKGTYVAEQVANGSSPVGASFALIVPDVASGYYASLLAAFEQAACSSGRSVVVCNSGNQIDKQASQILRLMDQGVVGVVLNPSSVAPTPACQVRMLQKFGIPVTLLHRSIEGVSAPLVKLSSDDIGLHASRLLSDAGHRRIAFMASSSRDAVAQNEAGFRRGLQQWGIDLPESYVACGDMVQFTEADYPERERCVEAAFRKLMDLPQPPTAVFVSFDGVAEVAYLVLQKMGLRVPEDISLVTFGGTRREGAIMQRLTTVTVNENAAAQCAVQLILEMREGKRSLHDEEQIILPLGVNPGETLKRLTSV